MTEREISIEVSRSALRGDLAVPDRAVGMVLFAHGSGSSRQSPRNRFVAGVLQKAGLATLLFDLLTEEEEEIDEVTLDYRFNIRLLADRLERASEWLRGSAGIGRAPIGLFGASTGAAAALVAAAERPTYVGAVVSRGGRPDLAENLLEKVQAPTLLIVGAEDPEVLRLNREAAEELGDCRIEIIPGATHLFEEPGALESVAELAAAWFKLHLAAKAGGHALR
jgi:dienelactone hydrolase